MKSASWQVGVDSVTGLVTNVRTYIGHEVTFLEILFDIKDVHGPVWGVRVSIVTSRTPPKH